MTKPLTGYQPGDMSRRARAPIAASAAYFLADQMEAYLWRPRDWAASRARDMFVAGARAARRSGPVEAWPPLTKGERRLAGFHRWLLTWFGTVRP